MRGFQRFLKTLTVLATSAVLLLMFAQCGPKKGGVAQTKITFYNAEGMPEQLKMISEIMSGFEKENPDIKVIHYEGTSGLEKILTLIAAGTPPDVFMWWADLIDVKAKDALLPLDEYIAKYHVDMSQYWNCLKDLYTYDGKLYGMPLQLKTAAIVYNEDLFDKEGIPYPKPGWTWEDFHQIAKKFRKDLNGSGIIDQWGCQPPYMQNWLYLNGSRLFDEKTRICDLNRDPKAIAMMTLYDQIQNDSAPTPAESQNLVGNGGTSGFQMGKIAMMYTQSWMLSELGQIKDFKWGVVELPVSLDGKKHNVYEGGCLCIAKDSKQPEAAFRFLNYYCGPKGMKIFTKHKNGIPAYKKYAYNDFLAAPNQKLKPFVTAGETADIFPSLRYTESPQMYWTAFFTGIDKLIYKQATVQQALDIATKAINDLLTREKKQQK